MIMKPYESWYEETNSVKVNSISNFFRFILVCLTENSKRIFQSSTKILLYIIAYAISMSSVFSLKCLS